MAEAKEGLTQDTEHLGPRQRSQLAAGEEASEAQCCSEMGQWAKGLLKG